MYPALREVVHQHLNDVVRAAIIFAESERRKTVSLDDALSAIEQEGDKMAYSAAMDRAAKACKI